MAESANGSGPTVNGSEPEDTRTPFERFEDLTKQLLSVPKAEIDERREKRKAENARPVKPASH